MRWRPRALARLRTHRPWCLVVATDADGCLHPETAAGAREIRARRENGRSFWRSRRETARTECCDCAPKAGGRCARSTVSEVSVPDREVQVTCKAGATEYDGGAGGVVVGMTRC